MLQYRNKLIMSRRPVPISPAKRDNAKMQQLIKQLMKVWSGKDVQENYQNYYLTYLDSLPDHLVELQISRQIKKTLENKSHYFNINKSLALHNTSIAKLKLALQKIDRQERIGEHDLQYVCELIDELRNNNLLVAENTLNFNYESTTKSNSQFGFVHGNNYIFEKINNDHDFLKGSFVRKYIVFTHSYDPFFLHHYETAKTTNDAKYRSLPCIEQLFNLSISKAYKAMKLQQQILQFLSGKVPEEREKARVGRAKRHSYNVIDDRSRHKTAIKQQQAQNISTFRLQNQPYMSKKQSRQLDSQQYIPLSRSKTDGDEIGNFLTPNLNNSRPKNQYHLPYLQRRQSQQDISQQRPGTKVNNHFLFKSRRPKIHGIGTDEEISPVTFKRNKIGNSISIISKREDDFRNQLPGKYAKAPVNEEILKIEQAEVRDMRQVMIQAENERQDANMEDPLAGRGRNHQSMPHAIAESRPKVPYTMAMMMKNFKLKAGNLTVHSLFIFLKELNIQQKYRRVFEIGNWQHSIRTNQYYLHKFYINQILMAISLSCALPEGDIVIKYWGATTESDEQMSHFLFKKYLEHIERQTICKSIFYNAVEIAELFANNFVKQRERIYRRQRSLPIQIDYFSYYPFLSIDFSIISIPRSTSKQVQQNITIPSNVYVPFSEKEFLCLNYLLIVNRLINPGQFSIIGTFTPYLRSMKQVQTNMIKQQLFFNPYNIESPANPINLLTLKIRNPLHSAFFIANKPMIKFSGEEIYRDKQILLVSLQLLKNNTKLYFGKGFRALPEMASILKKSAGNRNKIEYCVRMFGKRMRGKILSINMRDQVCFGDMEIVFEWRDFLKGRVDHNLSEFQVFGEGSFYCLLEIQHQHICAFQITQANLI